MKIALICVDAGGGRPLMSGNFRGVCPILNRAKVELIQGSAATCDAVPPRWYNNAISPGMTVTPAIRFYNVP